MPRPDTAKSAPQRITLGGEPEVQGISGMGRDKQDYEPGSGVSLIARVLPFVRLGNLVDQYLVPLFRPKLPLGYTRITWTCVSSPRARKY